MNASSRTKDILLGIGKLPGSSLQVANVPGGPGVVPADKPIQSGD